MTHDDAGGCEHCRQARQAELRQLESQECRHGTPLAAWCDPCARDIP